MSAATLVLLAAALLLAVAALRGVPALDRLVAPAMGVLALAALAVLVAWAAVQPEGGFRWQQRMTRLERIADVVVTDRVGREIGYAVKHEWLPLDALPAYVPAAFIAVEDQRFWRHPGFDPVGLARAAVHNIGQLSRWGEHRLQGASGIPMQTVRMMDPAGTLWRDHTLGGKLAELLAAVDLVAHIERRRILEAYLNNLYLGGATRGVEAGALHHFGCHARRLSLAQAAMLAGLTRAPNALAPGVNPPAAREARDHALDRILAEHPDWADAVAAARREPIDEGCARPPRRPPGDDVLRAVRAAIDLRGGDPPATIATTIDLDLQRAAERHVITEARRLERGDHGPYAADRSDRLQLGYTAVDARTGEIRALVCGRPDLPYGYDRCARSAIRVNSVIKPFLLACAVEAGTDVDADMGRLEARAGHPHRTDAWMAARRSESAMGTVRRALWRSDPYLGPLLWSLTPTGCFDRLKRLGVVDRPWQVTESYGTATLPPTALAAAFASLVNGGTRHPPRLLPPDDDASAAPAGDTASPGGAGSSSGAASSSGAGSTAAAGSSPDAGSSSGARRAGERVFTARAANAVRQALHGVVYAPEGTARVIGQAFEPADSVVAKTGTAQNWQDLVLAGWVPETGVVAVLYAFHEHPRTIVPGGFAGTVLGPLWSRIARDHIETGRGARELAGPAGSGAGGERRGAAASRSGGRP